MTTSRAFELTTFDGIQASDNELEQSAQRNKNEALTVLLIVVGMAISHGGLDGFGQMDSLNPSSWLAEQLFLSFDEILWISIERRLNKYSIRGDNDNRKNCSLSFDVSSVIAMGNGLLGDSSHKTCPEKEYLIIRSLICL
jgi:hypothetical protein